MKQKPIKLRMDAATYYIWVGGSCDYDKGFTGQQ